MDRLDFFSDRPGAATSSHILKSGESGRFARRILVVALAVALSACASRGESPADGTAADVSSISDQATDEAGQFVVNRALLAQARDELAVMSQPATPEVLDAYAHNRPPRSVSESRGEPAAVGPADLIDAEAAAEAAAEARAASGRSSGGLVAVPVAAEAARAETVAATGSVDAGTTPEVSKQVTTEATNAARAEAARAEAASIAASESAAPQAQAEADSAADGSRPGLFGRVFGWMRPAPAAGAAVAADAVASETGAAAADAGAVTAAATVPAVAAPASAGTVVSTTATETVGAAPASGSAILTTTETLVAAPAPLAAAEAPRSNLPGPGERGYIVSGHSSGGMQLAPLAPAPVAAVVEAPVAPESAAAGSTGTAAAAGGAVAVVGAAAVASPVITTPERPIVTPVTNVSPVVEREAPAIARVTVAPVTPAPVTSAPVAPASATVAPATAALPPSQTTASLANNPATATLPAVTEVPLLEERDLDRGSFATLMGAMHGMVERCEPATQMRDEALKNYRATYPAVELDRNSRDDPAARMRLDEEFVRSAASTLGSNRVNCDYVRSQSYGWNQLVGDLRHMSRDSARQYRPGLITEISRGAGIGRF